MKDHSVHPAEFAGWRPSMVDAALWQTILWATTDDSGEPLERNHDMSAAFREDMQTLSDQFYSWRDQADSVMIRHGFGELCLEDLLGDDRVEHCYILTRDGHGVGMADDWQSDSPEAACCRELESLAREQGELGAYVGDDGRIYLCCTRANPTKAHTMTAPQISDAARELELYTNNTEAFIRQAWLTLGKFHKAGTFNRDRGLAYLDRYVLIPAAKQYRLEHCGMWDRWNAIFPKPVRMEAADAILSGMVAEFRLGNYWEA